LGMRLGNVLPPAGAVEVRPQASKTHMSAAERL
jgi:hypothetical protein